MPDRKHLSDRRGAFEVTLPLVDVRVGAPYFQGDYSPEHDPDAGRDWLVDNFDLGRVRVTTGSGITAVRFEASDPAQVQIAIDALVRLRDELARRNGGLVPWRVAS